jgi:hypothetical protein
MDSTAESENDAVISSEFEVIANYYNFYDYYDFYYDYYCAT